MFHLFIKVINIEIGTKRFTQPETKNSLFFFLPVAPWEFRVSPPDWKLLLLVFFILFFGVQRVVI